MIDYFIRYSAAIVQPGFINKSMTGWNMINAALLYELSNIVIDDTQMDEMEDEVDRFLRQFERSATE